MKKNSPGSNANIWLATAASFVLLLLAGTASAQWTNANNIYNTNSGNVGIGTTSPGEKLDVSGTFRASGQNSAPASGAGVEISYSGGVGYIQTYDRAGAGADKDLYISGRSIQFARDNAVVAATISTAGNVGIGTTNPTSKLEVSGDVRVTHGAGSIYFDTGGRLYSDGSYSIMTDLDGNPRFYFAKAAGDAGSSYYDLGNNTGAVHHFRSNLGTADLMVIKNNGNVGIGIPAPGEKLEVSGNLKVSGTNAGNITATGTIEGGNIKARYQDVAEWVLSSEQITTGTVVVLDTTKSNQVISSTQAYDTRVAGVVSERPGIALGESGADKVLVATTGRVLVNVDASNGPIHIGDLLVTSDIPGLAMKSEPITIGNRKMHMPGTLIGKALEPLEKGSGKILVLLSLQ
jgi:hypothetical protein